MRPKTIVYIAQSLDGYIADTQGQIDWLEMAPNPDGDQMGYDLLMSEVDALLMGRVTFETVLGFDVDWPYTLPVYVLSSRLQEVPSHLAGKVSLVSGELPDILDQLAAEGHATLYIDGGTTIQSLLNQDLIDELRITTLPILLGGGYSLFGDLDQRLAWSHLKTSVHLGQLVQSHYCRER